MLLARSRWQRSASTRVEACGSLQASHKEKMNMPKKLYLGRGTIQEANAKKSAERAEKRRQKKAEQAKTKAN